MRGGVWCLMGKVLTPVTEFRIRNTLISIALVHLQSSVAFDLQASTGGGGRPSFFMTEGWETSGDSCFPVAGH